MLRDADGMYSEDDPFNYNFCIEYTLIAGQTVYLLVSGYPNDDYNDYYNLYVEKVSNL